MDILVEQGKRKVKIHGDGHGMEFLAMGNGWQWVGFPVDDDLLLMMRQAVDEYFNQLEANHPF